MPFFLNYYLLCFTYWTLEMAFKDLVPFSRTRTAHDQQPNATNVTEFIHSTANIGNFSLF